ncbi:MAG: hypothetical protein C6W55_00470 [Thermobacillus sp.]|uniref:DinB family protein n=1 Tax=Thermobacillus sp. TaxID=2108467 RepID=UPI000E3A89A5|nr:DinB family protein [Thermobacillus sp.]REK59947.1 MAG: hypothetical protein C6W55_00470 [Thermobacillus sp.]
MSGQADVQAFLDTFGQLQEAIAGLSGEALRWKEAPGKWSVTEVLAHLADHSIVTSFRIRAILAGDAARLPAFAQDAWVAGQKANEAGAADILAAYGALLHYNAQLLGRLTKAELAKTGVNAKGETVSIADLIRGFVRHVHHHLGQIDRIKQAQRAAGLHAPKA